MKLDHAMLLMEDFDIVPQLLPRRDIRTAFKLAADTGDMILHSNQTKIDFSHHAFMTCMASERKMPDKNLASLTRSDTMHSIQMKQTSVIEAVTPTLSMSSLTPRQLALYLISTLPGCWIFIFV